MHTFELPTPVKHLPIARIRSTHDLYALVPREIHHLLLVIDPASPTGSAQTVALEIAKRWGSQITLVHPGHLSGWQESAEESAETARIDLLCLSWQLKDAHEEVSISQTLPNCLAEVLDQARERNADLILLPEPLAARFRHLGLTMYSDNRGVSRCPIIEVMESESEWYR